MNNLVQTASTMLAKTKFRVQQHSPEILVVTGVVGAVASAVMACRATLKVNDILDEHRETVATIHEAADDPELEDEYSKDDEVHDLTITYVKTGWNLIKLYGPSVILGAASVASILGGHHILRKRNLAIAAAYTLIDDNFKDYRKRVIERFGEDVDKELKYNLKKQKITETITDENGKEKKVKTTEEVLVDEDGNRVLHSAYAKFFDETSVEWTKDPEYNLAFLNRQQKYANDLLESHGYLFLNDVYKMLGLKPTRAGQRVGWLKKGNGDGYVDFGIYNIKYAPARDFVNGYENVVIIDPNVDGVIDDKFERVMF